ncbi:MarR family winged helix-turn-helix transcriptional regulator [Terricaulis silvestris]|uniref:MarR family protein n=1 Tax=Terricaulis silvestris TaxID=2686094 RepID=A0A6I6MGF6_9CAUL|nr:MarR family transcriptional regulator [Terricaulis silvestris]QGZ93700.1 MarR family protein [Terricaulis silvestris]
MAKIDAAEIWGLNYRLLMSAIAAASPGIERLGIETKELFVLAEIDAHPYPAELAEALNMPKATVTLYVKRLEASGFLRREIDAGDLRRHRLKLTPSGRACVRQGMKLLAEAFEPCLGRLSAAQRRDLKSLLERMV